MANKPLIAVVPLWDDERESIWMLPGYMDGITAAGGIPIILPLHGDVQNAFKVLDMCAGLLLTGGHDVSPELYGEKAKPTCGKVCAERDRLEAALYAQAVKEDKPVLGICRGIQLINVLQGGTLYQDLPTQFNSSVSHRMSPPYDSVCHYVNINKGSPLYKVLQAERVGVNSYHHQAVKKLGAGLGVMAVSDDGLTEAVYLTDKRFVWAVQWHPEFNFKSDINSQKIFAAFISACK
ncbi:MAG: gamma-glutamyl-gamma-aminobutyrate hydrolase family protein [Clostridia bacterium]|nr:gamma-glutamyl-gamma-aminobutyrate hydrolase family protein [Clostridia bacterium]